VPKLRRLSVGQNAEVSKHFSLSMILALRFPRSYGIFEWVFAKLPEITF